MRLTNARALWRGLTGGKPMLPTRTLSEYRAAVSGLSNDELADEYEHVLRLQAANMTDDELIAAIHQAEEERNGTTDA